VTKKTKKQKIYLQMSARPCTHTHSPMWRKSGVAESAERTPHFFAEAESKNILFWQSWGWDRFFSYLSLQISDSSLLLSNFSWDVL